MTRVIALVENEELSYEFLNNFGSIPYIKYYVYGYNIFY